jgi:hypothetical protein
MAFRHFIGKRPEGKRFSVSFSVCLCSWDVVAKRQVFYGSELGDNPTKVKRGCSKYSNKNTINS